MLSLVKRQIAWGNRATNGETYSRRASLFHLIIQLVLIGIVGALTVGVLRWIGS